MKEHYFDDMKVGDRFRSEALNVTEKQVIEFAQKFDPQMFHLNRNAAEQTLFKGLIASGWHTAAMTMRLFVQTLNFVEGVIGLGVDELRWPNAVRPGDVLTVETEILDLRPSRSKPGPDDAGQCDGAAADQRVIQLLPPTKVRVRFLGERIYGLTSQLRPA